MLETLIVVAGVLALGALAWMVASLTPITLLWCAGSVIGLGLLLGAPGGVAYHLVLRRELLRLDALAPRWIWRPTSFHARLDQTGADRIRPWFYMGGIGFLLIVTGGALLLITLVTHFR